MSIYKRILFLSVACLLINFVGSSDNGLAASPSEPSVASRSSQINFTIQIGSYKNLSDAEREIRRIKPFAPNTFSRHEAVPGKGMWYRVYMGFFPSKKAADDYAGKLAKQKRIAGYWVKSIVRPFSDFIENPAPSKKPSTVASEQPKSASAKPQPPPTDIAPAPTPEPKRAQPAPAQQAQPGGSERASENATPRWRGEGIKVQAIAFSPDPDASLAVVNNRNVRRGALINGYEVKAILEDAVVIQRGEERWKVLLGR